MKDREKEEEEERETAGGFNGIEEIKHAGARADSKEKLKQRQ